MSESSNISYNTLDVELSDPSAIDQPQLKNQGGTACRRLKTVLLFSLAATIACGTFFMGRASVHDASEDTPESTPSLLMHKYSQENFPVDNFEASSFLKEYSIDYPSARELNDAAGNALASIYKRLAQIQGLDGIMLGFLGLDNIRNIDYGGLAPEATAIPVYDNPDQFTESGRKDFEKLFLWQTIKNQYARYFLYQMLDVHVLHVAGSVMNTLLGTIIRKCDPASGSALSLGLIDTTLCELEPDMCSVPNFPNYDGKDGNDSPAPTSGPTSGPPSGPPIDLEGIALEIFGESLCNDFIYTCVMCTTGCARALDPAFIAAHPYTQRIGGPEFYCETFCSQQNSGNPFEPGPPLSRRRVQLGAKTTKMTAEDVKFRSASVVNIDASDAFTCLTDGIHDHLERIANEAFQTTEFKKKDLEGCFTDPASLWFFEEGIVENAEDLGVANVMDCIAPVNGFLSLSSTLVNIAASLVNNIFGVPISECFEIFQFLNIFINPAVPTLPPEYDYERACPNWVEIGNMNSLVNDAISIGACAAETDLMMKEIKGCTFSNANDLPPNFFANPFSMQANPEIMETEIPLSQLSETINKLIGMRLMEKIQRSRS